MNNDFNRLVQALSDHLRVDNLIADEDGLLTFAIDGRVVNIHAGFRYQQVHLYAVLGSLKAPLETPLNTHLMLELLQANLFGVRTGGGTLAMLGDGESVVYTADIAVKDLSNSMFIQWFEDKLDHIAIWQQRLQDAQRISVEANAPQPIGQHAWTVGHRI